MVQSQHIPPRMSTDLRPSNTVTTQSSVNSSSASSSNSSLRKNHQPMSRHQTGSQKTATSSLAANSDPDDGTILFSGYLLVKWRVSAPSKRWGMVLMPKCMEDVHMLFQKLAVSSDHIQPPGSVARGRLPASQRHSTTPWARTAFPLDSRGFPDISDNNVVHLLGHLTKAAVEHTPLFIALSTTGKSTEHPLFIPFNLIDSFLTEVEIGLPGQFHLRVRSGPTDIEEFRFACDSSSHYRAWEKTLKGFSGNFSSDSNKSEDAVNVNWADATTTAPASDDASVFSSERAMSSESSRPEVPSNPMGSAGSSKLRQTYTVRTLTPPPSPKRDSQKSRNRSLSTARINTMPASTSTKDTSEASGGRKFWSGLFSKIRSSTQSIQQPAPASRTLDRNDQSRSQRGFTEADQIKSPVSRGNPSGAQPSPASSSGSSPDTMSNHPAMSWEDTVAVAALKGWGRSGSGGPAIPKRNSSIISPKAGSHISPNGLRISTSEEDLSQSAMNSISSPTLAATGSAVPIIRWLPTASSSRPSWTPSSSASPSPLLSPTLSFSSTPVNTVVSSFSLKRGDDSTLSPNHSISRPIPQTSSPLSPNAPSQGLRSPTSPTSPTGTGSPQIKYGGGNLVWSKEFQRFISAEFVADPPRSTIRHASSMSDFKPNR
ncbi:hypothetical protein HDU97_002265 [Phlyctochytrium planicorne]|nr:hypothetical protein HDU97_002265 [Phlyctochytrium planicorne]